MLHPRGGLTWGKPVDGQDVRRRVEGDRGA